MGNAMDTLVSIKMVCKVKQYMNCNSKNLIDTIICSHYNVQYIDCTTNSFKTRIRRHKSNAKSVMKVNISMTSIHFWEVHGGDTTFFKCMGKERVMQPWRGGDYHKNHIGYLNWKPEFHWA